MSRVDIECDVAIIGAGVLGISLAYHLSAEGLAVIVLEREGSFARHASGKNAGMFRQLYTHPKLTEWAKLSVEHWPKKTQDDYFKQTGSLIVGRKAPGHHHDLFEEQRQSSKLPAVYCPTDGLVDSYGLISLLVEDSRKQGVKFSFNNAVCSVVPCSQGWDCKVGSGSQVRAKWLVNSAGAWINEFLESSLQLSVQSFARHLFVIDGWSRNSPLLRDLGFYWDERAHWYIRRWSPNERLVSVCNWILASPDSSIPVFSVRETLAERILDAFPEEANLLRLKRSWHCFRTYTEDRLPIFGELASAPGLFWLAGFGGFGISTGFGASFEAAKYILGESLEGVEDFCPSRVHSRYSQSGYSMSSF